MSDLNPAHELEQRHLKVFGPDLGPIYHGLHNDVIWLHAKWLEYRKLFAHSERRVELLNRSAGFFFGVVQDVLWHDILLHIARLTDPPKQNRFENLSLTRLPEMVPDVCLANELRGLLETALQLSEFAREWRNKHIAHRDLEHALTTHASPLPGVSRAQLEEVLRGFRAVMNRVHLAYLDGRSHSNDFSPTRMPICSFIASRSPPGTRTGSRSAFDGARFSRMTSSRPNRFDNQRREWPRGCSGRSCGRLRGPPQLELFGISE